MRRALCGCIISVVIAVAGSAPAADAQSPARVYRIGWLGNGTAPAGTNPGTDDFRRGLRDAGYVEGQSFVIEYRYAGNSVERLPGFAAELVRLPVDVIVTTGESAALAAKGATKTVPIVATEFGVDPVKAGLVASLGRPDGNVTGLANISEELWQKRLEMLKQIAPKVARVAVLWNPANPGNARCVEELRAGAPELGMALRTVEVRDAKAVEPALASMAKEPSDAIAICWDGVTLSNARAIADFALAHRMPTVAPLKEYAQAGVLLSYGPSMSTQRYRSAHYVNRILKGARPADLPMEQPTLFEFLVSRQTLNALGLVLPPSLQMQLDGYAE